MLATSFCKCHQFPRHSSIYNLLSHSMHHFNQSLHWSVFIYDDELCCVLCSSLERRQKRRRMVATPDADFVPQMAPSTGPVNYTTAAATNSQSGTEYKEQKRKTVRPSYMQLDALLRLITILCCRLDSCMDMDKLYMFGSE